MGDTHNDISKTKRPGLPECALLVLNRHWTAKIVAGATTLLSKSDVDCILKEIGPGDVVTVKQVRNWFAYKRGKERKTASQPPAADFIPEGLPLLPSTEVKTSSSTFFFSERCRMVTVENDLNEIMEWIYQHSILQQTDVHCWTFFVKHLYGKEVSSMTTTSVGAASESYSKRVAHRVLIDFAQRLLDLYIAELKEITSNSECSTAFTKSEFRMLRGPIRVLWAHVLSSLEVTSEYTMDDDTEDNAPPPLFKLAFVIHEAWFRHFMEKVCSVPFQKDSSYHERVKAMDTCERAKVCYVIGWIAHKIFRKGDVWAIFASEIQGLQLHFHSGNQNAADSGLSAADTSYIDNNSMGNLLYPTANFFAFGLLLEAFVYAHLNKENVLLRPGLLSDIITHAAQDTQLSASFHKCLPPSVDVVSDYVVHLYNRCIELYLNARQRDFFDLWNGNSQNREQTSLRSGLIKN